MSWFTKLIGSVSGNVAEVDANNNLKVAGPTDVTKVGYVAISGLNDTGSVTGTPYGKSVYVTEGNKLAVGQSVLLWDDTFNATAQNSSKYRFASTTMTGAMAGGYLILNNSGITTINTNCGMQTFRSFPLFAKSEVRVNTSVLLTAAPQTNTTIEFGLFNATLPGAAAPTDGCLFRYTSTATLVGVVNYNGTETTVGPFTAPSANVNHDYVIVIQTNTVLFYIDDILQGKIVLLSAAPTLGQPMMAASVPWTARIINGGSAPALANKLEISDVFVTMIGPDTARPWMHTKAGLGHMAYQGQNGGTMGTTALYSNSLAAGAGTAMTNTTAAPGVGLGGQFSVQPTLAAGTDGILCSFQNPAGGVNQTPRNLIITGVRVDGVVTTAFTGGPAVYAYSLAYGHTAVSMATAETASFNAGPTTKAPRRIALGYQNFVVTAAAGTGGGNAAYMAFASPIVVAPGEFVAICAKNMGVVTSAGVVTFLVTFDAYYE